MVQRPAWRAVILLLTLAAGTALGCTGAVALNQRVYPLKEIAEDADAVLEARVVTCDREALTAVFVVDSAIKGKALWRWMALDLKTGGWGHPPLLSRRLAPGLPVVFFIARKKDTWTALGYANGTWFRSIATDAPDRDRMQWSFANLEVFLRRSFSGSSSELSKLMRGYIAKGSALPSPTMQAPGYGPEVPANYKPSKPLPELPPFLRANGGNDEYQVFEAEGLSVESEGLDRVYTNWMLPPRVGHTYFFSSGCTVTYCIGRPGQKIAFPLPVSKAGTFDLVISAWGLGRLKSLSASVDGAAVPVREWPPSAPKVNSLNGEPKVVRFGPVTMKQGMRRVELIPVPQEGDTQFSVALDVLALLPPGGVKLSAADRQVLAKAGVDSRGLQTALELACEYWKSPAEIAALYTQSKRNWRDVRWALYLERAVGRGGSRGVRRGASAILRMKQADPWFTWVDIRGVLLRGGELFMPTRDSSEEVYRLRSKAPWDDLDPPLMQSKFGGLSLDEWERQRFSEARRSPLSAVERTSQLLVSGSDLGTGWQKLSDGDTVVRRAGEAVGAGLPFRSATGEEMKASPPLGVSLDKAGWLVCAQSDGTWMTCRAGWRPGRTALDVTKPGAYLMKVKLWVPDHVEEVGEQRAGFIYIGRPSRYVEVGLGVLDAKGNPISGGAYTVRVEPKVGMPDTALVRVDITPGTGASSQASMLVTGYTEGRPEWGRAQGLIQPEAVNGGKVYVEPVLGVGYVQAGYVPEAYVTGLEVYRVDSEAKNGGAKRK